MENSEPIIQQEPTSVAPQPNLETNNPAPAPVPTPEKPKRKLDPKLIVIIVVAVLAVAALGVAAFFYFRNKNSGEDNVSSGDDSTLLDENEEILPLEPENPEEEIAQSGDEYIASQEEAINSSANAEEKFSNELNLASYYIAIEEYDKAQEIMDSFDTSSFTNEDFYRYYNIMSRLALGRGDTEKQNEYLALALQYRGAYQADSENAGSESAK